MENSINTPTNSFGAGSEWQPGSEERSSRAGRAIRRPTTYVPAPEGQTRKGSSRRKEISVVCGMCGRSNSPNNNPIVFCDGCNSTWHQRCHFPTIPDEVLKTEEAEWHCNKCKPPRRTTKAPARPSDIPTPARLTKKVKRSTKATHPRLGSKLPAGNLTASQMFTPDERRAYLSALSHAELVELLMDVSALNAAMPMFPRDMLDQTASRFPAAAKPVSTLAVKTSQAAELSAKVPTPATSRSSPSIHSKQKADLSLTPQNDADGARGSHEFESDLIAEEQLEFESDRKRKRTVSAPHYLHKNPEAGEAVLQPQLPNRADTEPTPSQLRTASDSTPSKTHGSHTRNKEVDSPLAATHQRQSPRTTGESNSGAVSYQDSFLEDSEPETEDDDIDTFDDHRLYPRPGQGFLTTVNAAELDILQEADDYPTFSHSLHGAAKYHPRSLQSHL